MDAVEGKTVGVIGLGAIGSEIALALIERGIRTYGFDRNACSKQLGEIVVSIDELVANSDLILGCTGNDVFFDGHLPSAAGHKVFASCTSSDVEFRSVLRHLPRHERFEVAHGNLGALSISILNGGYPINFDRNREWELFSEIILTRQLVLAGLLQAKDEVGSVPRGLMLNPAAQLAIVHEWLNQVPDSQKLRIPNDLDEAFFRRNSEGLFEMSSTPYKLHTTTPSALAKMRSHSTPYDVEVQGISILVLPEVWSPAYDWSSAFYIENFPNVDGQDFLEIGCGTGVISVFAARSGARRVVAVDINPHAVRNALLNFERYELKNADAFVSDGFTNVSSKFDIIAWNAPYHGSKPADMLERGCADEDYRDIRAFFSTVADFLRPGGKVIFGFSESGDLELIGALIDANGFRAMRKLSDWREGYNCMLFELCRI